MKITAILTGLFFALSCQHNPTSKKEPTASFDPVQTSSQNGMARAYFASGCFWCVEAIYESVEGVGEVISGYSGGIEENPTYRQVGYGRTTHAEAVEVFYNPKVITFSQLVDVFFGSHDPTTLNRQGPDAGPQYRSIAFYQNAAEKKIIDSKIKELNSSTFNGGITTQVLPFQKFWIAEDYHQDYEKNNPNERYIQGVSVPRLKKFKKKLPHLLKKNSH